MGRVNRYTQEARQALSNAREEAQRLRHRTISSEHLLLGMLRLNDAIIEAVFASCSASSTRVSQALEFVVGRGNKALMSDPALSASVRLVLTCAEQEATQMQAELIGVEHLFLALFCERDGVALGVLESFGLFLNPVRQQMVTLLHTGRDQVTSANQYQTRHDATPTLNSCQPRSDGGGTSRYA